MDWGRQAWRTPVSCGRACSWESSARLSGRPSRSSRRVARGAILGGSCRPDPQRNTVENIADGRVYFDIEFTPAYPAERITFTSRLTQDHLTTLVND